MHKMWSIWSIWCICSQQVSNLKLWWLWMAMDGGPYDSDQGTCKAGWMDWFELATSRLPAERPAGNDSIDGLWTGTMVTTMVTRQIHRTCSNTLIYRIHSNMFQLLHQLLHDLHSVPVSGSQKSHECNQNHQNPHGCSTFPHGVRISALM